jgi:hypothetical protein
MHKIFVLIIFSTLYINHAYTQGCVAVRSNGASCTMPHADENADKWIFNTNYRYFKSFRHYRGSQEQKDRVEQNTEVINHVHAFDLSLTRVLNERWSLSVGLPIISNGRSSLYEHGNKQRHLTHSFGIGDMRVAVYRWLLNPSKFHNGNIQLGLGLKLPTGDYKYLDYFYNDTSRTLGPVDQSIQLGDGGTGITSELNAYFNISPVISVYGNFYYLLNPREQNGVSTARGGKTPPASIANGSDVMSVPDQYMARAGASVTIKHLSISAGLRDECVPVYDLIGGSGGFRRPGYVISVEPSLTYKKNKVIAYLSTPYALKRDRTQSVPDKIRTRSTGTYTQGDAAFADYSINAGVSFKF